MNKEQIEQQLAAIENSISGVNVALLQAKDVADFAELNNRLVQLKSERTRLQLMLLNLESAAAMAAAGPDTAAAKPAKVRLNADQKKTIKEASKALAESISDRSVVQAALDQSNTVLKNVHKVQTALSGGTPSVSEPVKKVVDATP